VREELLRFCNRNMEVATKLGGKPEITRFKVPGEISPAEFKQFIGNEMRLRCFRTGKGGIRAQSGKPANPLLLHG